MAVAAPAQTQRSWRDGEGRHWRSGLATDSDRSRFDAFVWDSPRGNPLQLWSWGEVKAGDAWAPLRVFVEREGRMLAACSIVEKALARSPGLRGGSATRPPGVVLPRFWLAHRGPVVDPTDPEVVPHLWAALRALAPHHGALCLRCDPEWPEAEGRLLRTNGLRPLAPRKDWYLGAMQPLRVWRISLQGGPDGVLSRMESHTRYDIRRSERKGTTIREGRLEDLPAFYALERANARRKSFALRSPEFFTRLWRAWNGPRAPGRVFVAEVSGRFAGAAWFVVCGRGCWGQFVAADHALRRHLPTVALYWAAIRWAISRGCTFCDFGGIGHREDPADGLWAFKKGFGPGDTRFCGEHDLVFQPLAYQAFRLAEEGRWAWYAHRGG